MVADPQLTEANTSTAAAQSSTNNGRSLDDLQPAWSPDSVASLDVWKQGDLLRAGPRFWAAPGGVDPVLITGADVDWGVLDDGEDDGWVAVTSQTCDIAAAGPGRKQPFVEVSPAFRLPSNLDASQIENIRNWGVTYLAPLTAPPGDGVWAVDLRLTMSVSKGLLVGQQPIEGFLREADRLNFGEFLGVRKRRPSLHDVLTGELLKSLCAYVKSTSKAAPEWWQNVEQVRMRVEGDRLRPTAAGLIIIEETKLEASQRKVWRDWSSQARRILRPHGITLIPMLFSTIDDLSARLYRDSVALRMPELSRPARW